MYPVKCAAEENYLLQSTLLTSYLELGGNKEVLRSNDLIIMYTNVHRQRLFRWAITSPCSKNKRIQKEYTLSYQI